MTDKELARLIETVDLTGGVVIYDNTKVEVVTKWILTHPDCIRKHRFLFLIDKKSKIRVGGVMELYDDIQIYIKPAYRGKGYTTHVMREVVPYWLPELVSITSYFKHQNSKIKYLASCAGIKLRKKGTYENDQAMAKRKAKMLKRYPYAQALLDAENHPEALRDFPEKVRRPRRLRKDYGIGDAALVADLDRSDRINFATGNVTLPSLDFEPMDLRQASPEEIYLKMRRLCKIKINDDFDYPNVDIRPKQDIVIDVLNKSQLPSITLHHIFLRDSSLEIGFKCSFTSGVKCVNEHAGLSNQVEAGDNIEYKWGELYVDDDCIDLEIIRDWSEDTISKLIQKYQIKC